MSTYEDRLKALRAQLVRVALDGFVVPLKGGQTARFAGARGVWSAAKADA